MPMNGKAAAGPLTPTLAANYRAPNRQSPQTPRLASTTTLSRGTVTTSSKNLSPEKQPQGLSASKELANNSVSIGTGKKKNGPLTPITKTPTAAPTAATLLGGNITPRSSARRSRTDSNKSTPTSTPTGAPTPGQTVAKERAAEIVPHSITQEARSRRIMNDSSSSKSDIAVNRPKLQLLPSSSICSMASLAMSATATDNAKFFHASDASKGPSSPAGRSRPGLRKAATFFYANASRDRASPTPAGSISPALSAVEREAPPLSKFCYVDEAKSTRSIISPPPSLTSSPASSAFASPTQPFPSLRPPSPLKENIHLSYRKGVSQVIKPSCHRLSAASLPAFAGQSTPTNEIGDGSKDSKDGDPKRRMSSPNSSAIRQATHVKRSSLSSIDSGTPTKRVFQSDEAVHRENPLIGSGINGIALFSKVEPESNDNIERLREADGDSGKAQVQAGAKQLPLMSPSIISAPREGDGRRASNTQMSGPDMAELAANARRERKVLDLEISNSSLLAINRQLEREVRKQKVELRRFRRLSRAGHISLGRVPSSSSAAKRCISCSTAATNPDELDDEHARSLDCKDSGWNEDGYSDTEDDEDEEDTSASDLSSVTSMSKSHICGRLARDERRLRLDLTKHRELLIDSQKMNQGLRRCIDWTEELVRNGRRALDYKVRVSDVKLGGRVLRSEDDQQTDDEIEVVDSVEEDLEGKVAAVRDAVDQYADSGADFVDDVSASVDTDMNSAYNADDNGEEIPLGGPLLSPWRSQAGLKRPQQRVAQCASPTLPVVSDYFGTEALRGIKYCANTASA